MGRMSKWSPEFREESVRLYRESGESIAVVARRLGMSPETLRRWIRDAEIESGERDGVTRRRAGGDPRSAASGAAAGGGEVDPSEGGGVFRQGDRSAAMTFRLIDRERAHHAVSLLCSVLGVTRQGYWAWSKRPASAARLADEQLKARILELWRASHETYGAPRLHAELCLGDGLADRQEARRPADARARASKASRGAAAGSARRRRIGVRRRRRILSSATFRPRGRTRSGSRTSPTSRPMRAGCSWPRSWICTRAGSSAGACATISPRRL